MSPIEGPTGQQLSPSSDNIAIGGQAGMIAPPLLAGVGTSANPGAQTARLGRFVPPTPMLVTKIAFPLIVSAGSDDSVDVGIYDSGGNRLVSTGATLGVLIAASGVKVLTFGTPLQLTANTVYYAAFLMGLVGTTPAQVLVGSGGSSLWGQLFGSTAGTIECAAVVAGVSALPAAIAIAGAGGSAVIMAVRTA